MSIYDTGDDAPPPASAGSSGDELTIPDYAPEPAGAMEGMGNTPAAGSSGGAGDIMMKVKGDPVMMKKVAAGAGVALLVIVLIFVSASGGGDSANGSNDAAAWAPGRFTFVVSPGRFVAGPSAISWTEAKTYCETTYPGGGLASVHSFNEQRQAASACAHSNIGEGWGSASDARALGCWIGLNDAGAAGKNNFQWTDRSPVDFLAFAPAEPNECAGSEAEGEAHCHTSGEDYVEMHVG